MYKINEVATIAGISTRTLRYYDKIGLLSPSFLGENGYRFYSEVEIDDLQQILFYKELHFSLTEIKTIVSSEKFNYLEALHDHKKRLQAKQKQISKVLKTIDKTIQKEKGEVTMTNDEKFSGLKEDLIKDNEIKYGKEVRKIYSDASIDGSYQKIRKMSKWEFNEAKRLEVEIIQKLSIALKSKDFSNSLSMEVCALHEKWIKMYWPTYSQEAHLSLVKMYTEDERFKVYYEKAGEGATAFLYQAMKLYIKKDHKK